MLSERHITLTEYETKIIAGDEFVFEHGVTLWRSFDQKGKKIRVAFPSPKTDQQWEITAQGWVGHIPIAADLSLSIQPKVHMANILRMWEYAYALRSFQLLEALADVASLPAFYERIVHMLLQRVQRRERQGLYHAYQTQTSRLHFVRGQVQHQPQFFNDPSPQLLCRYDEHTADIPDNQILAFTLAQVARSRRCSPALQTAVRRVTHHLQRMTTPHIFRADACVGRPYNRLNQDYQLLHALCRFLLEHQSPDTGVGDYIAQPFLINMARLYELFVSEWLRIHLPAAWQIKVQESVVVGRDEALRFDIDLVLYDGDGRVHAVLDTKYKTPDKASNPDISQVVTYAQAKGCPRAILIYPVPLPTPLDAHLHNLHVHSLTFALDGDLDENGRQFLAELLP